MVFAIALVLAQALAAPQPDPSPGELPWIKTIVTVKAKPVCTTLRDVVAPAVQGLRVNDAQFAQSTSFFLDATRHENAGHLGMIEMDMMRLGTEENEIAANINRIDTLLSDLRLTRSDTQDDRSLSTMKAHLELALAKQKDALNIISGRVETHALRELLQIPDGVMSVVAPEGVYPRTPGAFAARETIFAPTGNASALSIAGFNTHMLSSNYYHDAQAVALGQVLERPAETAAAQDILRLVDDCRE